MVTRVVRSKENKSQKQICLREKKFKRILICLRFLVEGEKFNLGKKKIKAIQFR